ncbi:transcriptional regulator TyrR [Aestuariibacter salexigens]|uniref:transcriptional regulator TyrR n=1 Tax=Aestuariibacter salexigens TaxID=226010 RepID=UPI000416E015|nr:transcriptional regulator TyrR [Aestuariibacter salexigens]
MRLEISCQDRLGIAQDVLDILVNHAIDLRGIEIDRVGKIFLNFPNIEFKDFQHLMPEIRRLEGIEDVKTTPFMPIERDKNQLQALLQTLPDPVFSLDTKGRVLLVNDAVLSSLELRLDDVLNREIGELVSGFNFVRWLENNEVLAQTHRVKFIQQDYLADILPVTVTEGDHEKIIAGAVVLLKSESRLGQQISAFHQTNQDSFSQFTAASSAMRKVIKEAKHMSALDAPMLVFGETGTGKTYLAKACHQASRRADKPCVVLPCNAMEASIIARQLFGQHCSSITSENASTGALERANEGTLILQEVGELPAETQQQLLAFIRTGTYCKLGSSDERRADVRLICTSSQDLTRLTEEGKFNEQLFYQLNVLSLLVPPLRDRRQDVVSVAERLIKLHSANLGRRPPKLNRSCVEFLQTYPWPGNVKQLENALYRALSLVDGNEISKDNLQVPQCSGEVSFVDENFEGTLDQEVKRFEKELLRKLYPSYPSTRQLAKKLGLSHTAIANKLREYGISKKTIKL